MSPSAQSPPTLQPTAPQRAPASETSAADPDRDVPLTPTAEPGPSEPERPIPSRTEAARGPHLLIHHRSYRPPLLLDTAICVLLVLVVALFLRRVL